MQKSTQQNIIKYLVPDDSLSKNMGFPCHVEAPASPKNSQSSHPRALLALPCPPAKGMPVHLQGEFPPRQNRDRLAYRTALVTWVEWLRDMFGTRFQYIGMMMDLLKGIISPITMVEWLGNIFRTSSFHRFINVYKPRNITLGGLTLWPNLMRWAEQHAKLRGPCRNPIWTPIPSCTLYESGWWYTYSPEKYWSVGMMTFPTEWKNNKCLKPPTRNYMKFIYIHRITWASAVAAWAIPKLWVRIPGCLTRFHWFLSQVSTL